MSWTYGSSQCSECGEPIIWITTYHGPVPIHDSGSCPGRSGGWFGYGSGRSIRIAIGGEQFEFPFVTGASYFQPNAKCPLCEEPVWLYQSPSGECIFLTSLGPPWNTHGCNGNTALQKMFRDPELRKGLFSKEPVTTVTPAWARDGWMPFIVEKSVPRLIGVDAVGELLELQGERSQKGRIHQAGDDAQLRRCFDGQSCGFNLIGNTGPVMDAFIESPILLRRRPEMGEMQLSAFMLRGGAVVVELDVSWKPGLRA